MDIGSAKKTVAKQVFLKKNEEPKEDIPQALVQADEFAPQADQVSEVAPMVGLDAKPPEVKPYKSPKRGPIGKGVHRAKKLGKKVATGLLTAIKVLPSIATLVLASAASRIEGWIPGNEKLSAIEWLQARTPGLFNKSLENLFSVVGDSTVNSTGLSIDNMIEVDEHIYKSLAPGKTPEGVKKPAEFISQLAAHPFSENAPRAAFIYLGEGRSKDSKTVMDLWNSEEPPTSNPFEKDNDLHRVWEVLEEKVSEKKLPVFIDLDGDAHTFTSTEYISKEIMNSMVTRHNNFGDGFQDPGLYYAWLDTRQKSFYNDLDPWIQKKNPALHESIGSVKTNITPPWLGGKEGLGPWPSPRMADKAYQTTLQLAEESGQGATQLANFADGVVALDRDIVTGTMTHWIKLNKETSGEKGDKFLEPLAKAWIALNVNSIMNPELAIPSDSPRLRALEGPPARHTYRHYDRALAVGEVVDHTLDGLGILDRKKFMTVLRKELKDNLGVIQGQDQKFVSSLEGKYEGIDFGPVLENRHDCQENDLQRRLEQLREVVNSDNGLSVRDQAELRRHYAVADWLVNAQVRYGDVKVGLIGHADAFKENPLGVSQYFDQLVPPSYVSILGPGPAKVDDADSASAKPKMKVSLFREGGGGKGMAYPTPSRALKAGLKSLDYEIDDGGGNSAGIIPSLMEAAGLNDDEIEEISAALDFKEFNADAIPLLGGTDPKIGGINHTGLFSSQKMYKDLYKILSEKLGIQGRPILFRDLPRRLAMTATVMNTDLPKDDPLRELIDNDKRMVMSTETTPNFDVIGAVTASTAVPGYFNAPQIQVSRSVINEQGQTETQHHRMQFVDGGVVDNFPISAAKKEGEGKTALVVVPAFYETIDPETGEKIGLQVLNFDDSHVEAVNKENAQYYKNMMPKLDSFLAKASEEGYSRVVIGMNLTDLESQTEVLIQGQTEEETDRLLELADGEELPHMDALDGRDFMEDSVNGPSFGKKAAGLAFNIFLDGQSGEDNEYSWGFGGSSSRVGEKEEENLLQVIRGIGSSALATNAEQEAERLFEKPS